MIVSSVQDRTLQAAVRMAARPDEDVVVQAAQMADALRFAYPRLAVQRPGQPVLEGADGPVPAIYLSPAAVLRWQARWRTGAVPCTWVEFVARQLTPAMRMSWCSTGVDGTLRDLSRAAGRTLPASLVGLMRRVLEFPNAYIDLASLGPVTGLSAGALKARFRRRHLPSPHSYLRLLRCLAAAAVIRQGTSVASTARRLGWTTSGNLCRDVSATLGRAPSSLAEAGEWETVLAGFARTHLTPEALEAWDALDGLFLARVA